MVLRLKMYLKNSKRMICMKKFSDIFRSECEFGYRESAFKRQISKPVYYPECIIQTFQTARFQYFIWRNC